MKYAVLVILTSLMLLESFAPDAERITALVSARVDTSSTDVKAIITLYENYLNSQPETIHDSPYWNKREKELYDDFDFSRASLFNGNMTAAELVRSYSPFIMSVEPIGSKYQIRVMFSSATTDIKYAGSKVWCIQKLNAVQEDGHWVLENLLVELSKKWETRKVGSIQYVFPPSHKFSTQRAERSTRFCKEIIQRFNPEYKASFKYYVTSSVDEMGLLENFDYYFVGVTTGKAREYMVLSAKGDEFYPHEFVHKLLPENENRGFVIEEGFAVFLGTREHQEEYSSLMTKLATDLEREGTDIRFESVVSQLFRFNGYQTAYPAGAALCELVYQKAGDKGLRELMLANTRGYDHICSSIRRITGLQHDEVVKQWNTIVLGYGK